MGYLDRKASSAIIFANISAGTGSVLKRCCPDGIWCFHNDGTQDFFSVLSNGWKPSFVQLGLHLLTILVTVYLLLVASSTIGCMVDS